MGGTHFARTVRRTLAIVIAAGVLLAACGGDDGGHDGGDAGGDVGGDGSETASDDTSSSENAGSGGGGGAIDIDAAGVCALLSDSEIESLLGAVVPSEPNGPDSPFPGCSWRTGRLIVQVAPGDAIVLAPGQECPSVDIGDAAVACPGSVQFVTGGSRVLIQTIEDVTEDQLVAVARVLLPKIESSG